MAGIFNLFGGTTHAAKESSLFGSNDPSKKSMMQSSTFETTGAMAGKNAAQTPAKPKGLSMRSTSQLNVVRNDGTGGKSPKKKSPIKALAKVYLEQSECISKSISPRHRDKSSKMQVLKSKQLKAQSSKSKSPNNNLANEKKQADDVIFKKPSDIVRGGRKGFDYNAEPEVLSFYYDDRSALACVIEPADREFAEILKARLAPIKPFEDKGFHPSDPEMLPVPTVADLCISDEFPPAEVDIEEDPLELPEISDDEFLG